MVEDKPKKEETKEEVKEESEVKSSVDERLLDILEANQKTIDKAIPEDGQTKAERQLANQESNYRLHPDKVVVFEVSMSAIDKIDGTNGWHDIVTGSPESLRLGLSTTVEMTKDCGLIIADRFEVKMNRLPVEEWHCEYVIVDRKVWEESRIPVADAMLGENEQFGDLMMRRGME